MVKSSWVAHIEHLLFGWNMNFKPPIEHLLFFWNMNFNFSYDKQIIYGGSDITTSHQHWYLILGMMPLLM
jgi:hypothetical protein